MLSRIGFFSLLGAMILGLSVLSPAHAGAPSKCSQEIQDLIDNVNAFGGVIQTIVGNDTERSYSLKWIESGLLENSDDPKLRARLKLKESNGTFGVDIAWNYQREVGRHRVTLNLPRRDFTRAYEDVNLVKSVFDGLHQFAHGGDRFEIPIEDPVVVEELNKRIASILVEDQYLGVGPRLIEEKGERIELALSYFPLPSDVNRREQIRVYQDLLPPDRLASVVFGRSALREKSVLGWLMRSANEEWRITVKLEFLNMERVPDADYDEQVHLNFRYVAILEKK